MGKNWAGSGGSPPASRLPRAPTLQGLISPTFFQEAGATGEVTLLRDLIPPFSLLPIIFGCSFGPL